MTETDSFVYEIKKEDFYEDMKGLKEQSTIMEIRNIIKNQERVEYFE